MQERYILNRDITWNSMADDKQEAMEELDLRRLLRRGADIVNYCINFEMAQSLDKIWRNALLSYSLRWRDP